MLKLMLSMFMLTSSLAYGVDVSDLHNPEGSFVVADGYSVCYAYLDSIPQLYTSTHARDARARAEKKAAEICAKDELVASRAGEWKTTYSPGCNFKVSAPFMCYPF